MEPDNFVEESIDFLIVFISSTLSWLCILKTKEIYATLQKNMFALISITNDQRRDL